ncbi:sn-glycerol-3-phosphate ABC transporter permease UgpA [Candidimonas nitroreducens]|uniref:sn-glycerol-3-phosphate transport system permease protein UgpA n=1 Tax=Candidimonas nitroreducens TaxID=683354 RepID=A0A225M836_9BURK|nr:sn-glycerol-3-phosphate ABC transporter permease UgpA [Candidimonas nitroreducens]OWT57438.1 glycerol-3-phosphate transporter permease [Candidimonas nitroreducens]
MIKRAHFEGYPWLVALFLLPQLLVLSVFAILPAIEAFFQAFMLTDPFGQSSIFVGLQNFKDVLSRPEYMNSVWRTIIFSAGSTSLSMIAGLAFAVFVNHVIRGKRGYKMLLLWPYAISPVVAGVLWLFLFHPTYGAIALMMRQFGFNWDPLLNGNDAMFLVIVAASWKQVTYNFVFFLASLQAVPKSLIEAAAIDGAGPIKRLFTIIFPLMAPITFFLLVINVIHSFFDTFPIIDSLTQGGPAGATDIMVYRVYHDGFVAQDLGGSSAQSVILMLLVVGLTFVQFRYIEKKIKYSGK